MPAGAALKQLGWSRCARPEGRAGADQRHPGVDRDRARHLVRRRAGVRIRACRRGDVDRRPQGHRAAVRPAHPRARGQPGQIAVAAAITRPARGQRDRRQPRRLRPGPGPLQLPLPAAGDGRRLDLSARPRARWRSRRMRSPTIRCCSARRRCRAAISTPSRSPSPPTCSRWPCARSARSRSGAPRSWSTPR